MSWWGRKQEESPTPELELVVVKTDQRRGSNASVQPELELGEPRSEGTGLGWGGRQVASSVAPAQLERRSRSASLTSQDDSTREQSGESFVDLEAQLPSEGTGPRLGPLQIHRSKAPDWGGTSVGFSVLAEPDLRGSVGEIVSDVVGTTSLGSTTKTHSFSASLASRGDDTTHVKFGSVESSSTLTPSTGKRLLTAKANASVAELRAGSKENYFRVQGPGVEANLKVDRPELSSPSAIPVPRASVRAYAAAVEVGGSVSTGPFNLPFTSTPVEVSFSGKGRASVGSDVIGQSSKPRIPVPGVGDLKFKVSGGFSVNRAAPRDIETGHGEKQV